MAPPARHPAHGPEGIVPASPQVLPVIHHRVDEVNKPAQPHGHLPQVPGPPVLPPAKQLGHQKAEAVGRQVRIGTVLRLQAAQVPDAGLHGPALPGKAAPDGLVMPPQKLLQGQRVGPPVVAPVVPGAEIGQGHVHIRRVGDGLAPHPGAGRQGMDRAPALSLLLRRFVQRRQQQSQKYHIVIEHQPAGIGGVRPDGPADAAVASQVPLPLPGRQLLGIRHHISKHGAGPLLMIVPCYRRFVNRKLIF